MKRALLILLTFLLSLSAFSDVPLTSGLYLPFIAGVDWSPDTITGVNIYRHCPSCPNVEQIGTNVQIAVWAPGTNYFKLDDKTPLGTQFQIAGVVVGGGETEWSYPSTNYWPGPGTVLNPVRK